MYLKKRGISLQFNWGDIVYAYKKFNNNTQAVPEQYVMECQMNDGGSKT